MSTLIKKSGLGILLGVLCIFLSFPTFAFAEGDLVKDMFPENADEQGEESPNDNTENNTELGETPVAEPEVDNGSLVWDIIKMVFALLLILVLIYLLLKFLNKRNKLFSQVRALENLGGITVGPSKSIQLVRVGSKIYLIGVGENVQLLEEIEDEAIKNELLQSFEQQTEFKAGNILSVFQSKAGQATSEPNQTKNDFKNLFSSELEKLKQNRKKLLTKQVEKEDSHE